MKSRLTLLALPFLALACNDTEQPTPLAPSFDVVTEGLVSNTIQVQAKCANGVTGVMRYIIAPSGDTFGIGCGITHTFDATGVTGVTQDFDGIVGAPDCGQVFLPVGDFPTRTKCTVNGRDVGGKPLATFTAKYVKD